MAWGIAVPPCTYSIPRQGHAMGTQDGLERMEEATGKATSPGAA